MMRLGLVSAILPELSLERVLEVCAVEEYSCVEVMCWPPGAAERRYAGVTHIDVTQLGAAAVDEIAAVVDTHGVEISGLGYYPNALAPDEAEAEHAVAHIRKVINGASILKIPVVNTFIGRDWTRSIDDNWERFKKVWPDLIRFAEDHGVKVAIENCPMLFTKDEWPGGKNLAISPVIWRRMFNEIPSASFGLNYDPSHLVWQGMDPIRPIREFGSKFFHVHAKDAHVHHEKLDDVGVLATPLEYHSPRLPGLGDVNWGQFFGALNGIGYRGAVCVEVEDRAYEGSLDDRLLAVRQSRAYLHQFCPS
jgi:sugar phosphate isomerase/epimerase